MRPRSKAKLSALITALLTLTALIVPLSLPAAANHPANTCLDVEPETDTNPISNTSFTPGEDNRHVLTATLRSTIDPNAGPPPTAFATCEGTGPGANSTTVAVTTTPVNIDFEISGVNDTDGADTPDTPDLTCSILPNQTSCQTSYVGTVVGTDTIRGWIDHDAGSPAEPGKLTEADRGEGQNSTTTPGTGCVTGPSPSAPSGPEPDCTDVVTKTWAANTIDCEPESEDHPVGEPHTVNCTVHDSNGNPVNNQNVDAEASGSNDPDGSNSTNTPDFTCTTGPDGKCSYKHGTGGTGSTNNPGRTTYRSWVDEDNNNATSEADETETDAGTGPGAGAKSEPDNTDVTTADFGGQPGQPFTLDCDDQTGPDTERETNPSLSGAESTETYTCTVRDPGGSPVRNATVHGENENGINDPDAPAQEGATYSSPDYTCSTPDTVNSSGQCTVEVAQVDGEDGTAEICFWVEGTGTTPNPPTQGASNCGTEPTGEAQAGDGSDTGNDLADQVEKTWEPRTAAAAGGLDAEPETDTNTLGDSHTITATVYDQFGTPFQGNSTVRFEFFQGSPTDTDGNTPLTADRTCTTNNSSSCSTTYTQATTAGKDLVCVWINATPTMAGNNTNGTCDGEGRSDPDDDPTAADAPEPRSDDVDVVEKNWAVQRLNCEPETDSNPTGTAHTITCTASDASGNPTNGVNVDAEATGANDPDNNADRTNPDFTCTTDSTGTCTFTHGPGGKGTTNSTGTTLYRAWIDSDSNDSTDNSDATEERDENRAAVLTTPGDAGGAGATAEPDGTDVMEKTWTPGQLDCEPETANNQVRSSHTVTCTVRDGNNAGQSGWNVDVEATGENDPDNGNSPESPDFTCFSRAEDPATTSTELGTCTFTHGPGTSTGAGGRTEYRAWIDADNNNGTTEADQTEGRDEVTTPGSKPEKDDTDVVEKNWQSPGLECTPETDSNPTGTSHTITCTDRSSNSQPVSGAKVDAEATGANDPDNGDSPTNPDFTCTTDANGQCSFTHTGNTNNTGTTTYRAWVDSDDNNNTTEADSTEGRDEQATAGGTGEPDDTDVVEKRWVASRLDCTPETATNETSQPHRITCTARDNANAVASGTNIDVEATGANDPDNGNTPNTPDFTCTTAASGACDITHNATAQAAGSTVYRAWIDADGTDATVEADTTETRDETTSTGAGGRAEPDDTDVVEKTWVRPPARTIDCEPETATKQVSTTHTVTCTVRDTQNRVLPGESVTFNEEGPGDFTTPTVVTTDSNGRATATVTSTESGEQTVTGTLTSDTGANEPTDVDECDKAAGDPSGAPAGACSDSVAVTWTAQANECSDQVDNDGDGKVDYPTDRGCSSAQDDSEASPRGTGPCENAPNGSNVIIGTSGDDTLVGTSSRDIICAGPGDDKVRGLGGNDKVLGNDGDDTLNGNGGKDSLSGGKGKDKLRGGDGNDSLDGGGGRDDCRGDGGKNKLTSCE